MPDASPSPWPMTGNSPGGRPGDLQRQRASAKVGMVASMGVLTGTGIMVGLGNRNKTVRTLHVVSGFALLGFSLWHYSLYGSRNRST